MVSVHGAHPSSGWGFEEIEIPQQNSSYIPRLGFYLRTLVHVVIYDSGKVSLEHPLRLWYPSQIVSTEIQSCIIYVCRINMEHIRPSRPDYGLGFDLKVSDPFLSSFFFTRKSPLVPSGHDKCKTVTAILWPRRSGKPPEREDFFFSVVPSSLGN